MDAYCARCNHGLDDHPSSHGMIPAADDSAPCTTCDCAGYIWPLVLLESGEAARRDTPEAVDRSRNFHACHHPISARVAYIESRGGQTCGRCGTVLGPGGIKIKTRRPRRADR